MKVAIPSISHLSGSAWWKAARRIVAIGRACRETQEQRRRRKMELARERNRRRRGTDPEDYREGRKPVVIGEMKFPSIAEAARAMSMKPATLWARLKRGTPLDLPRRDRVA